MGKSRNRNAQPAPEAVAPEAPATEQSAPEAQAPEVAAPAPSVQLYTLTPAGVFAMGRENLQTKQRAGDVPNRNWRANPKIANSLRAAALCAIMEKSEGMLFTKEDALQQLTTVHLGSKTPASRWRAFTGKAKLVVAVEA